MSGEPAARLFELRRTTFDTPAFRGIEFVEVQARSIINHVPGSYLPFSWTVNPYRGCSHACTYCFARVTHTYLDLGAGRDFETKIYVKVNAPELLRKELRARRWKGEHIAMGTATDPYQRAEGRYRLMPRIIEALAEVANPFSILTKGTLILRDLELLAEAARTTEVSTALSVGTLDEDVWRRSEPGTPHPRKRIEAVRRLNEAGVPCSVLMAPILPGISDGEDQMRAVIEAALGAGAPRVTPILLHLRPVVRDVYLDWLAREYPDLLGRYAEMYARAYAGKEHQDRLALTAARLTEEARAALGPRPPEAPPARFGARRVRPGRAPQARQLSLL